MWLSKENKNTNSKRLKKKKDVGVILIKCPLHMDLPCQPTLNPIVTG